MELMDFLQKKRVWKICDHVKKQEYSISLKQRKKHCGTQHIALLKLEDQLGSTLISLHDTTCLPGDIPLMMEDRNIWKERWKERGKSISQPGNLCFFIHQCKYLLTSIQKNVLYTQESFNFVFNISDFLYLSTSSRATHFKWN